MSIASQIISGRV